MGAIQRIKVILNSSNPKIPGSMRLRDFRGNLHLSYLAGWVREKTNRKEGRTGITRALSLCRNPVLSPASVPQGSDAFLNSP